jgi:hypothetical protein
MGDGMSGYPKIWTLILDDSWFKSLSAVQRGIFLQLILMARRSGKDGEISARSISELAMVCGTDRGTMSATLRIFQQDLKISVVEKSARLLKLKLMNYLKWQEFKSQKEARDKKIIVSKTCGKNRTINGDIQSISPISAEGCPLPAATSALEKNKLEVKPYRPYQVFEEPENQRFRLEYEDGTTEYKPYQS